jgi:AcrR family transcriptional regulator
MPRGFTQTERERIRDRLFEEGERLFAARGVRRTTVDEIARAAGIAKGSFYRFARSKEEFFFDLLEHAEAEIRREIEEALARTDGGSPGPEQTGTEQMSAERRARIRVVLDRAAGVMYERPLFRMLTDPEELAYLARAVPPERLARHAEGDTAYFKRVLGDLLAIGDDSGRADVAAGIVKVLVMLPSLESFVGPEIFPAVRDRLSRYIADGLEKESR